MPHRQIIQALEACEAYLAERADADIDATGMTGNEEMHLLVEVETALARIRAEGR